MVCSYFKNFTDHFIILVIMKIYSEVGSYIDRRLMNEMYVDNLPIVFVSFALGFRTGFLNICML